MAWTLPLSGPPQHPVKLQLVNTVLRGGLVVSVHVTTAIGQSEQNIAFLNRRCAPAVRLASRSKHAHCCAERRHADVPGFVVSEELHPFVRTVVVDEKTHSHTHSLTGCADAGGSEAQGGWSKGHAGLPGSQGLHQWARREDPQVTLSCLTC